MKKIILILFLILTSYFLNLKSPVYGHGSGLPPFFKVNGVLPPVNPVLGNGIAPLGINVAQDLSPDKYLVNEPINFEIDVAALEAVFPKEVLVKTKFYWDFGDGTKTEGIKNSHTYTKIGSFILSINADYQEPSIPPQLAESVQLEIVPDKNYQLPVAKILVNGKEATSSGLMEFDLNNSITFDAKASTGKITEYLWDFGNGKTSNKVSISHQYKLPQYFISPTLQIKDENGFISTTIVNLKNSGKNEPNNPSLSQNKLYLVIITGVIILIAAVYWYKQKK